MLVWEGIGNKEGGVREEKGKRMRDETALCCPLTKMFALGCLQREAAVGATAEEIALKCMKVKAKKSLFYGYHENINCPGKSTNRLSMRVMT